MTAKKIDHKAIQQKIAKLPGICEDGKKAVAELLKELGYVPPKPTKPKVGEVWMDGITGSYYLIAAIKNDDVYIVPLENTNMYSAIEKMSAVLGVLIAQDGDVLAYRNITEYALDKCR